MRPRLALIILSVIAILMPFRTIEAGEDVRTFKLHMDNGEVKPVGGDIYYLAIFTADGKPYGGSLSADFRSTVFDISLLPEKEKVTTTVAVQISSAGDITHTVNVDARHMESFFINKDYIVLPKRKGRIEKGGPFIRLKFHRTSSQKEKKQEPLNEWEITLKQKRAKITGRLSPSGFIDFSHVTKDPIHCFLKDPSSSKPYEYTLFPAVQGARKGLVIYSVWDVTNPRYEASK